MSRSIGILCAAFALSAGLTATPAGAQEPTEEIIVRGFRGSLGRALEVKRSETGAVDSIMAEDIADFPDLNLAESLQRIPGVSIARDAGEGRQITVRGLGPNFTRDPHQWHGRADHGRRHGQLRRHQSRPPLRFQYLRLGAVLQFDRAQDVGSGDRRRLARRDGGSTDAAAIRLSGHGHVGGAARRLQRSRERCVAARDGPVQQHQCRSDLRRTRLARVHRAQLARGRAFDRSLADGALTCPACDALPTAAERTPRMRPSTRRSRRVCRATASSSTISSGSASRARCSFGRATAPSSLSTCCTRTSTRRGPRTSSRRRTSAPAARAAAPASTSMSYTIDAATI